VRQRRKEGATEGEEEGGPREGFVNIFPMTEVKGDIGQKIEAALFEFGEVVSFFFLPLPFSSFTPPLVLVPNFLLPLLPPPFDSFTPPLVLVPKFLLPLLPLTFASFTPPLLLVPDFLLPSFPPYSFFPFFTPPLVLVPHPP
jgi:hypothetical protein